LTIDGVASADEGSPGLRPAQTAPRMERIVMSRARAHQQKSSEKPPFLLENFGVVLNFTTAKGAAIRARPFRMRTLKRMARG
jgi:hypothetical protein